jgi:predicted phosphate transport protein (TIGR00153 family)
MFKKHRKLFEHLDDYYQSAIETTRKFQSAIEYTLQSGVDEHFEVLAEEISEKEQNCDNLRRLIEYELFSQSLLPETREDLIEIIEKMDGVPNYCEEVVFMIVDQRSEILDVIKKNILELVDISLKSFVLTVEAAKDCMGKMENTQHLVREVDDLENLGNQIERKMVRAIFSNEKLETHPGGQMVQKEIVKKIGEINDICRHISEKIIITAVKRRV